MSRNFVVIGAGSIGSRHVRNLIALGVSPDEINVIDPRMEALRELPNGVAIWSAETIDETLEWTRTLVSPTYLICSPAETHAALIKEAIRQQRPFFVEKPPALAESDLTDDEWNTDVPHVVGFNWRWHRGYRRAEALARAAERVAFTCFTDMNAWPGKYSPNALAECCHDIDLAIRWCGPVCAVDATLSIENVAGPYYRIILSHDSGQTSEIDVAPEFKGISPIRSVAIDDVVIHGDLTRLLDESYLDELDHFLRVCDGAPSLSTLDEARWVVSIIATANAKVGTAVTR